MSDLRISLRLRAGGLLFAAAMASHTLGGNVVFVDDDAPPVGDGTTWDTAYRFLQDALADAFGGGVTEIRVGQGTYKADRNDMNPDGTGDREATFQLINSLALMGGYAGIGAKDPNARDIELYETILSGDLLGDDGPDSVNNDENSYHVVTATNANINSVLDGFTITGGNADSKCCIDDRGGGMLSFFGTTTIANCTFVANQAMKGGAIYWEGQAPDVQDCVFVSNAAEEGGAIFNRDGSPSLVDCVFEDNFATVGGGAIANKGGSPQLSSCWFRMNGADFGGAIHNDENGQPTLTNCLFEANLATFYGGALYNLDSTATIQGCSFLENSVVGDPVRGGAIASTDSTLVILDCLFSENFALGSSNSGGALTSWGESATTILDSTFQFNWSSWVGAVLTMNEATLAVDNCDFINNFSFSNGGAVRTGQENAELTNCMFFGNIAQREGGGVQSGSGTTLTSCVFIENSAGEEGGGVHHSASGGAQLIDCRFERNAAVEGGGAWIGGPVHGISNCEFTDNWAIDGGGGLWVEQGEATITDCLFTRNRALREGGGGLQIAGTEVTMARCSFSGNSTPEDGGGIQVQGLDLRLDNVSFSGNTANRGGAVEGPIAAAVNCTFAGNEAFDQGGGIFDNGGPTNLLHCILWNNRDANGTTEAAQITNVSGPIRASYSCIEGLVSTLGVGNISADPLFVRNPDDGGDGWGIGENDDFGDLHLMDDSPCINTGDPLFTVDKGVSDFDGEPRIQNCRVDMGVDETPVGSDCNGNGESDSCDIYMGVSQDCNANGIPDECDLASGASDDCNGNGIPDDCDVVTTFAASSGQLSPIGENTPQSFTIESPPPVLSDVRLSFTVFSDLNAPNENVLVDVNGTPVGVIFQFGAHTCPDDPDVAELFVPKEVFDLLDVFIITMVGSSNVNDDACGGESYIEVSIEYLTWSSSDMDGNGIPDECEIIPGDIDGDGLVGVKDLLLLLGSWGDCPDPPKKCPADLDGDGVVGVADLLILLGNWS